MLLLGCMAQRKEKSLRDHCVYRTAYYDILSVAHMGVSKNNGTPKSSILIGFSIINHPFWGTPIFGNTHILFTVNTHLYVRKCSHPSLVDPLETDAQEIAGVPRRRVARNQEGMGGVMKKGENPRSDVAS